MGNLAIIPARGGSKRIPKKNIKLFDGKPIIAHVIQTVLDSKLFDEVMVSTDSEEIATIAKEYGAKVPFKRSEKNADDYATLADVLIEVITSYQKEAKNFDKVCCILPTAALITKEKIKEGLDKFNNNQLDSVVPVVRFAYPIQRALKVVNQKLELREPEHLMTRSQDLEPMYHDSGQFYWISSKSLLKNKKVFMDHTGYIELNENEVQDVDTMEDWMMLEVKYKIKNKQ